MLDPVGAGASALRTATASELIDTLPITVIRGNMSEVKAVAGAASSTRGVDVNPDDVVTDENLAESAAFARELAAKARCHRGHHRRHRHRGERRSRRCHPQRRALMGKMTGAGCVLSCLVGAYVTANPASRLGPSSPPSQARGLAGQIAASRMGELDGNGSFRTYLLDAICNMTAEQLAAGALVEEL